MNKNRMHKQLGFITLVTLIMFGYPNALGQTLRPPIDNELYDSYLCTQDGERIPATSNCSIIATSGSVIENRENGIYRLKSGMLTATTRDASIKIETDSGKQISIPKSSTVTIKIDQDSLLVTANDSASSISITGGESAEIELKTGRTFPSGASPLGRILASAASSAPIFFVGKNLNADISTANGSLALVRGRVFLNPSKELQVKTPLGLVTAKGQSMLFISVLPDSVEIFNCRGDVRFSYGNKFRSISASELFTVFDHRPTKEEVLPADGIGRKEITLHDLDGQKVTAASTSFSVVTLLQSPEFLGDWKHRSLADKKIEAELLDVAAAGAVSTNKTEEFYRAPELAPRAVEPLAVSVRSLSVAQQAFFNPALFPTGGPMTRIGEEHGLPAGSKYNLLNKLPSRMYLSCVTEVSQRFESNVVSTAHHPSRDYVFRVLPNVTLGYNVLPRTSVFANYFMLKDQFANTNFLNKSTFHSVAGGIQHDIPIKRSTNLQLQFQARQLFQAVRLYQADLLPSITLTHAFTPRLIGFYNSQLQLRSRNLFGGASREIDPFYTIGMSYQRGNWLISSSGTLVTNFRNKTAVPPISNNSIICDFEVAHPIMQKRIPGLYTFLRAEPIWNWGGHSAPGLSGFDFRLFSGLRLAISKPSTYAQMQAVRKQLKLAEASNGL